MNTLDETCKLMSMIYYKEKEVSMDELERIFIAFFKQLASSLFNIPPVAVSIVDNDCFMGCYNNYITFQINRKQIEKFKNGKALSVMETICHELLHFSQKREYQRVNIKNSIIEKDAFLSRRIKDYYHINYDWIMVEIDAFISQQQEAIKLLEMLGITPSEDELKDSNLIHDQYQKNIEIKDIRVVDNQILNINDVFKTNFEDEYQNRDEFDINNFLEFCPCINIEYGVIGNSLKRRSKEEIEKIYNNYKSGTLKIIGDEYQIDTYFQYLLYYLDKKQSDEKTSSK